MPALEPGQAGEAVRDLQRRLGAAGFEPDHRELGTFGPTTEAQLIAFQGTRGIRPTGRCDQVTWATLVEAGFQLGDRLLYLRAPMLRGDDVADLQHRLGALGFDAGRVDGIFGPQTELALKDFQRNMGLTTDGVLGRDTRATLLRLGERARQPSTVAQIRDRERSACEPRDLHGQRVAVGEPGGLGILVAAIDRRLVRAGAAVLTLHDPDPSVQAQEANRFEAAAFVGLAPGPVDEVWYYENRGFASHGGRALAGLLADHAARRLAPTGVQGRWHPILRETRMPAVQWNLTAAAAISSSAPVLAAVLHDALDEWLQGTTGAVPPESEALEP